MPVPVYNNQAVVTPYHSLGLGAAIGGEVAKGLGDLVQNTFHLDPSRELIHQQALENKLKNEQTARAIVSNVIKDSSVPSPDASKFANNMASQVGAPNDAYWAPTHLEKLARLKGLDIDQQLAGAGALSPQEQAAAPTVPTQTPQAVAPSTPAPQSQGGDITPASQEPTQNLPMPAASSPTSLPPSPAQNASVQDSTGTPPASIPPPSQITADPLPTIHDAFPPQFLSKLTPPDQAVLGAKINNLQGAIESIGAMQKAIDTPGFVQDPKAQEQMDYMFHQTAHEFGSVLNMSRIARGVYQPNTPRLNAVEAGMNLANLQSLNDPAFQLNLQKTRGYSQEKISQMQADAQNKAISFLANATPEDRADAMITYQSFFSSGAATSALGFHERVTPAQIAAQTAHEQYLINLHGTDAQRALLPGQVLNQNLINNELGLLTPGHVQALGLTNQKIAADIAYEKTEGIVKLSEIDERKFALQAKRNAEQATIAQHMAGVTSTQQGLMVKAYRDILTDIEQERKDLDNSPMWLSKNMTWDSMLTGPKADDKSKAAVAADPKYKEYIEAKKSILTRQTVALDGITRVTGAMDAGKAYKSAWDAYQKNNPVNSAGIPLSATSAYIAKYRDGQVKKLLDEGLQGTRKLIQSDPGRALDLARYDGNSALECLPGVSIDSKGIISGTSLTRKDAPAAMTLGRRIFVTGKVPTFEETGSIPLPDGTTLLTRYGPGKLRDMYDAAVNYSRIMSGH